MKNLLQFTLFSFLISTLSIGQVTTYQPNGNTGFGGAVGSNSSLEFSENSGTITGTFTKGTGFFDDAMVIYISNGSTGRSVIDASVNDQSNNLASAISSAGVNESEITFHSGFSVTHAIAINVNNGELYSIPSNGTIGDNDLTLIDTVGNPTSTSFTDFTFDFDYSEIGLSVGDEFKFVITYLNAGNGFTSNEGYPGNFLNDATLFLQGNNVGSEDYSILSSYTYPSDNQGDNILYNDFYRYFNPFNESVKSDDGNVDKIASWAYAANSADAFGGIATFENPDNESVFIIEQASFIMSNWDDDITNIFVYPFTLELYEVDRSGQNPAPGQLIATIDKSVIIPLKEDFTSVASPNAGYTDSVSSDYIIEFDLNGLTVNTDEVLFMVGFEITSQNDGPDANNLDDRLDQMNIAAYKTDNSSNPQIVATPTFGTKTGNDVFWRSDSNTNGQISFFSAGTVISKFTGDVPNTWQGDEDNDFSNANNWEDGVVPDETKDAIIPDGTPVSIINDPNGNTVRNLIVENNASVEVNTSLKVNSNIDNDGTITFISNENGTGQFGSFDGQINGNGDIVVQRFIPVLNNDTRGFRLLASAVDSDESIFDNWQEGGASPIGFGTQITGSTAGNNGFDPSPNGNVSLFTYNFSDIQNIPGNPVNNTDVRKLETGESYRIFIRGDRNYNLGNNPPDPPNENVTLQATGDLATGDQTYNLNVISDALNAVGNPYQANVNFNNLTTNNVNTNFYWMFDPNIGRQGAYVAVELPNGETAGNSQANQFIQPGQAFFVQTLNNAFTDLTFSEDDKDLDAVPTQVFLADFKMDILLYSDQGLTNGDNELDALRINFSDNGDNSLNENDAFKFPNPSNEDLARFQNGEQISIENRASPLDDEVLPLFIDDYEENNYTFVINITGLPTDDTITPFLDDSFDNSQTELDNGSNQVSFTVDLLDPNSIATNRFSITFDVEDIGTASNQLQDLKVYPNPVDHDIVNIYLPNSNNKQTTEISLFNMLGQRVLKTQPSINNRIIQFEVGNQSSGVYLMNIKYGDVETQKRLIIK